MHVPIAELREPPGGDFRELLLALDGEDLGSHLREHRRGVAGTRADLEHAVAGLHVASVEHRRDDVRLRDGLPAFDWKRRIVVGELGESRRDEGLPRDGLHSPEHVRILDVAARDLRGHHLPAELG